MDAPPSLGRRAVARPSLGRDDNAVLPTATGGSSSLFLSWWRWKRDGRRDHDHHSGSGASGAIGCGGSSSHGTSKGLRLLRRLMVRSKIGAHRRMLLLVGVAACLLLLGGLLLCVHHHTGGSSGNDSDSGTVTDTNGSARGTTAGIPSTRHQLQQQQKQIEKEVAFPMVKRAFVTAEQLSADSGLTMPVQLPFAGAVVTGEDGRRDLDLSVCSFDIAPYHRNPPKYSKAKHLFKALCEEAVGTHLGQVSARALAEDASAGRQLQPSGFVFHESRVGSTLVANMLASVPTHLTYSEPHLPMHVVHECARLGCSDDEAAELLRLAILAMGRSHHHDELFIKFQSSMTPHMHLVLKAFPDTPWIFIHRNPVEVMVSNIGDGHGGPCTSHKAQAPAAVQAILGVDSAKAAARVGNEEYCAARLAFLRDTGLTHLQADGSRGFVVSYDGLVDELLDVVLPGQFGLALSRDEHARMAATAQVYSKALEEADDVDGKARFAGDAEEKQAAASGPIKRAAKAYLAERERALAEARAARRPAVQAAAALRATQDAYVYERTGSRPFGPPSCPDEPAYPAEYPVVDMLRNWNPDDTSVPARHYASLCRFNYADEGDRAKAARYEQAEVPFVLYNVPALDNVAAKWNEPGYLDGRLGDDAMRVEISKTNHFLYFSLRGAGKDYEPPTRTEHWTYADWRAAVEDRMAAAAEAVEQGAPGTTPAEARRTQEHYYFRVSTPDHPLVEEDVKVFGADAPAFFKGTMGMEEEVGKGGGRGIHCRFGMEGVVAEAHYDGHRNWVAAVGGTRRWILAAPKECRHAYLRPTGDPSARHSAVNWTAPDLEQHPAFADMAGTEVLLVPGDVVYVPSFWIHFITSLGWSAQCNSRSGRNRRGLEDVQVCGFHVST